MVEDLGAKADPSIPESLHRTSSYLTHPVFHRYRSETEMLRYIKRLEARDLSLTSAMIPLGSCTMKLNATTEMVPLSRREWVQPVELGGAGRVHRPARDPGLSPLPRRGPPHDLLNPDLGARDEPCERGDGRAARRAGAVGRARQHRCGGPARQGRRA